MNKIYFNVFATVVVIHCVIPAILSDNTMPQSNVTDSSQRILSRGRRYLIFPEGSSLQLVYDSTLTIPDYTLLVTTGVTVALAWGLPFKPVYIDDELQTQYEQGHLPLLGRNDENITDSNYIDTPKKNRTKTTGASTTIKPIITSNIDSTRQNLVKLFHKFYETYPNRYNSIMHNHAQPNYVNKLKGDYPNYNNYNRILDNYYFGQAAAQSNNNPVDNNRMKMQSKVPTSATSSASLSSSAQLLFDHRPYAQPKNDYTSKYLMKNGPNQYYKGDFNGKNSGDNRITYEKPHKSTKTTPPPYANPNPYAEFANYLTQTYFRPWQDTNWDAKANKTATSKKPKTKKSKPKNSTETPEFKPQINRLHTAYPAMGKRSIIDPMATNEDKFYLDHHRNTRHELLGLIEKYVYAKGHNGTACVLKTLCEVGQRRVDNVPGSFLAEIVRVIFSLPAQLKPATNKLHASYHAAQNFKDNCANTFSECTESIWNAGFLVEMIENKLI